MPSRLVLFKTFCRLGFVPWDGHPLAHSMQNLIEGEPALPAGRALDIGCPARHERRGPRSVSARGHRS